MDRHAEISAHCHGKITSLSKDALGLSALLPDSTFGNGVWNRDKEDAGIVFKEKRSLWLISRGLDGYRPHGASLEIQDKGECQRKQESLATLATLAPGHPGPSISSHVVLGRCPRSHGLGRKLYCPTLRSSASTVTGAGLMSPSSLHLVLSSHFLMCALTGSVDQKGAITQNLRLVIESDG